MGTLVFGPFGPWSLWTFKKDQNDQGPNWPRAKVDIFSSNNANFWFPHSGTKTYDWGAKGPEQGAKRQSAEGVSLGRGVVAPPQHRGRGSIPQKIFFKFQLQNRAFWSILPIFASNITESVSLKICFLFLSSNNAIVKNVMSCFYLIFEQLICFLNFTLSSLSWQIILVLFSWLSSWSFISVAEATTRGICTTCYQTWPV